MYLFAAIIFGILLSIFTKISLLKALFFLVLSIIFLAQKNKMKLYIFSLITFLVFTNFSFRNYNLNDFSGMVTGKVISSSENKSILKTSSINGKNFKTKILIYEKLERGAGYKIAGKFTSPLPSMNEGNFDYNKNYKAQGIYAIGNIKNSKKISKDNIFYKISNSFTYRAKKFFVENLDEKNSNIITSIVLADRSLLDQGDRDRFNLLGMSHILAVSGLHIGVIVVFLESIIKGLTKNKKLTDILVTLIILFYLFIIGFPISATRAFLFYILYKGNIYLKKDLDLKKIYFLSLGIILFINPMSIYSISLILSYGAIFGLIFVYPFLDSRIGASSLLKKSFLGTASVIISLGFILGLGIFPSFIGKILNILMNATFALESLFISKGSLFLKINAFKFNYIFIYYILLLMILYRYKLREIIEPNIKIIEIYMAVFFVFTSLGILRDYNTYRECHLYVDQGDCTLISYRGKNYLIDTGGARKENKIFEKFLFPTLKVRGISKIDGIFLSHFDEDHAGNLNKILKKNKVKNIFINHLPDNPEILKNAEKFSNIVMLKKGDKINICRDTIAEVLCDNKNSEEENDNSMVLLINHRGFKTLFTGDISENVEKKINRNIDILKVAHHGSKTSTSYDLLENTRPKIAVISAGVNNSYGHPHEEVLQNLEKHGIIYYVTSRDGEVDFNIFRDKLRTETKIQQEDYYLYILLIFINSILLYRAARENYELQKNLQRWYS